MDKTPARSEKHLRNLQLITSSRSLSFDEKIKAILKLGLESFDLDVGILSNTTGDDYIIVNAITPNNDLFPGTKLCLQDTYCYYTLENACVTAIHHAAESEWKHSPCYHKSRLEAYIGCPVYVNKEIYGTLNFSSVEPIDHRFDDSDLEFLQLIAQWLGLELEHQLTSQNLLFKNRVLATINRTNEDFIANLPASDLFNRLLNDILDLTKSEYGFITEVLQNDQGQKYFKPLAKSKIAWNEKIKEHFDNSAPNSMEYFDLNTLYAEMMRRGNLIISNDATGYAHNSVFSADYPGLKSFLGIPLCLANEFVGILALANRPGGYDKNLLTNLEPLLATCSKIINAYHINRKRQETEATLRKNEDLFQTIFQCAPFGVALINMQGYCHLSNNAFQKMLGYSQTELMSRPFSEFSHPLDRTKDLESYKALMSGECDSYACERRYFKRNGDMIWASLALSIIRDTENKPYSIIAMMHDVTQKKSVERELKRFKTTLDQTLDCVFMFHPDNLQFFYVNQGAIDQVGYQFEELMQIGPLEIKPYVDHEAFMKIINPLIKGERSSVTFETMHLHKKGRQIPVEIFLQYIAPEGEEPRFVAIVRDISERKKIDKMKNEFISTVSHELRTPLTSIRGSLGLIEGGGVGKLPEEMQSLISIAHRNVNRLIVLINDILDMDKISSGKMQFNFNHYSLSTLLKHAIENNIGYAEQYAVNIKLQEPENKITVFVDSDRFGQVMSNLISNATKFSPQGESIEISAMILDKQVKVSIHDEGPGVPHGFQAKIFKKFTQADSSDSRQKGGTGLGLSITKALLENMGGKIGFENTPGKGTTFYFLLPIVELEQ